MATFIDLCSGIGGGRLGLEKNGFKCLGFSEILKTSIQAYKTFFDTTEEKNLGDLTKLSINEIPNVDILIAGFPCQAFSIQGLRKGFEDERGQIIFYIQKILKEKNIKYFILENVKGLTNHKSGETLNSIVQLLEEVGYNVFFKVLKSNDYGLPQKRERIYFVGIRKDLPHTNYQFPKPYEKKAELKDFLIDTDEKYNYTNFEWLEKYMNNKYNVGKYKLDEILNEEFLIVDTRQSDMRFFREHIPTLRTGRSGILYVRDGKLRKLSGRESLLLQGFGKKIFEKAKGYSDSILLQQTGNAMSVNVIESIGYSLKEIIIKNGDL
jgi:DNA (cytosine-5)-methyltransferase 1